MEAGLVAQLHHETAIAARPEAVWDALIDVAAWSQWNPTYTDPDGPLVPGKTVRMKLALGPVKVPMRQQVTVVEAPRQLLWHTVNVMPGLMDVDRYFRLTAQPDGTTLFSQGETAQGWMTPVLSPLIKRGVIKGFAALGDALRERVLTGARVGVQADE